MLVRVVDYQANLGGGVRFSAETIAAFAGVWTDVDIEVISYGIGVQRYARLLSELGVQGRVRVRSVKPANEWRARPPQRVFRLRGTARLRGVLGAGADGYYQVPGSVFEGCDVVWLPWAPQHRVPRQYSCITIGTLHDILFLQLADLWRDESLMQREWETAREWIASDARVVVTSRATLIALQDLFRVPTERLTIIPLLARHSALNGTRPTGHCEADAATLGSLTTPPLLCPANISPQKNHEVLFRGVGAWGARQPLVLTGEGTDLASPSPRAHRLQQIARECGLECGDSLFPLGYVPNHVYYALLRRSWALVMPTLGEGGGSFPVLEAMLSGVPVVCADIPVMREQIERTGGRVLWFDPGDHSDLRARLIDLENGYAAYRRQARQQVREMRVRSWREVAQDYRDLMLEVAEGVPEMKKVAYA